MKALKDNWTLLVAIILIGVILLYLGKCGNQKEIEAIVKMNEEGTKALQQVIDDLEKARNGLETSIKDYNDSQAKTLKAIEGMNAMIAELKKKIGTLPAKEVFTNLAKCNVEYAKLYVQATAQGQLILTYEAQIADYKLFVQAANAKESEWMRLKSNFESEIGAHKSKAELDRILINALKKKLRQDLFALTFGGYYDLKKKTYGISLNGGVNLKVAWKLVKGIF